MANIAHENCERRHPSLKHWHPSPAFLVDIAHKNCKWRHSSPGQWLVLPALLKGDINEKCAQRVPSPRRYMPSPALLAGDISKKCNNKNIQGYFSQFATFIVIINLGLFISSWLKLLFNNLRYNNNFLSLFDTSSCVFYHKG